MKQIWADPNQIVLCELRSEPRINILFDILTNPNKVEAITAIKDSTGNYLVLDGNNRALAYKCLNQKARILVIEKEDYNDQNFANLNLAIPLTKYEPFNKFKEGIKFLKQAKVTNQEIKKIIAEFKEFIKNYYHHYPGLSEEQKTRIKTVMIAIGVE